MAGPRHFKRDCVKDSFDVGYELNRGSKNKSASEFGNYWQSAYLGCKMIFISEMQVRYVRNICFEMSTRHLGIHHSATAATGPPPPSLSSLVSYPSKLSYYENC